MKFAVLITMLIASCLCAVKYSVRVRGIISCRKSFFYSVNLWDDLKHDLLGNLEPFQLSPNMSAYEIFRTDWGGWFERSVDPVMTIEHTCGTDQGCVCKDFRDRTHREIDSLYAGLTDVNFVTTDLMECDLCGQARKARGFFRERNMKLIVLISVLIASLFASVEVQVTVRGKLTCPTPFKYRITLWEKDKLFHDLIGKLKTAQSSGTATYEITGMAKETNWSLFESEVEPWMTIEYTCGSVNACICKELGDHSEDFETTVDVDLEKPGLEYCGMCKDAVDKRGEE